MAALFPDAVPAPLAWDPERRWMLLADLGRSLRAQSTVAAREAMLRQFGHLQIAAAPHVDHLLTIGCLDRRLACLARQIDPLLDDTTLLGDLTKAEVAELRALAPRLKAMCRELADYHVPATLVHGDLNLGNVALHDEQYVFFDWTDACVSHPFFDLLTVIWEDDPEVQAHLLERYLHSGPCTSRWTGCARRGRWRNRFARCTRPSATRRSSAIPKRQHGTNTPV